VQRKTLEKLIEIVYPEKEVVVLKEVIPLEHVLWREVLASQQVESFS
jgi:hypothetical protein